LVYKFNRIEIKSGNIPLVQIESDCFESNSGLIGNLGKRFVEMEIFLRRNEKAKRVV
jgi:hypothetical protein